MKFSVSFCDPLNPEIMEMGDFDGEQVLEIFDKIPWDEFLEQIEVMEEPEYHYAPSLEIINSITKSGLEVSAIDETEWHIFFRRQKMIEETGGATTIENDYLTEIIGQTEADVKNCLNALIANDLDFLEEYIK